MGFEHTDLRLKNKQYGITPTNVEKDKDYVADHTVFFVSDLMAEQNEEGKYAAMSGKAFDQLLLRWSHVYNSDEDNPARCSFVSEGECSEGRLVTVSPLAICTAATNICDYISEIAKKYNADLLLSMSSDRADVKFHARTDAEGVFISWERLEDRYGNKISISNDEGAEHLDKDLPANAERRYGLDVRLEGEISFLFSVKTVDARDNTVKAISDLPTEEDIAGYISAARKSRGGRRAEQNIHAL